MPSACVRAELDRRWRRPPRLLLPLLAIGVGDAVLDRRRIDQRRWPAAASVALLAPRKLFAGLEASGAARGKIEFARELLTEAEPHGEPARRRR